MLLNNLWVREEILKSLKLILKKKTKTQTKQTQIDKVLARPIEEREKAQINNVIKEERIILMDKVEI